jgi:hypothetical protein
MLMFVVLAAAVAAACSLTTGPGTGSVSSYGTGPRRILFVGNSLTSANDMPAMLVALAESAGVSPLPTVDVDWLPDFALVDHWSLGNAQGLIGAGHYNFVVLQQGPSSVEVNRDTLRLAAKLFAPVIRATGGMPALLAVWPTIDRLVDFDRATQSYQLAANDVHGYLFPGGEVWRAAWRRNPDLQFYSDGLHPNALGSYAVALSIFGMLYDRSTVGLPAAFRLRDRGQYSFDPAVARLVQESADEANRQFGIKGTP